MAISNYTRQFQVKYDKRIFRGKKACCEYYNISYRAVLKYISKTHCSFSVAIDHYRKLNKKFYYRGRNWKSFRECCSFFHINYSNFAYRFYLCTLKIQYLAGIRLSKFYPLPYAA